MAYKFLYRIKCLTDGVVSGWTTQNPPPDSCPINGTHAIDASSKVILAKESIDDFINENNSEYSTTDVNAYTMSTMLIDPGDKTIDYIIKWSIETWGKSPYIVLRDITNGLIKSEASLLVVQAYKSISGLAKITTGIPVTLNLNVSSQYKGEEAYFRRAIISAAEK